MEEKSKKWIYDFEKNFCLPPPDDNKLTGWTLTIEELQDFSLSRELQNTPGTATNGMKIYVSVFNKKTGLFHGRTWESPLITNYTSFNQSIHGILCGNDNLIVIEFSFQIRYYGNETSETSLFFTVASTEQHYCPLYIGSPRFLLQNPTDYSTVLTTRPGQLIVELQQNNDLLRAKQYIPLCTFMNKPPPGVVKLAPLSLENSFPLIISDVTLNADSLFHRRVNDSLVALFAKKYKVPQDEIILKVNKYIIHIAAHNGFTMLNETFKLEVKEENKWRFDNQITIQHFVNDPHFAILVQLVAVIEINTTFMHQDDKQKIGKKQMFEIPLGFHVFIPTTDESVTLKLSQEADKSPFCTRTCNAISDVPPISFNVSYSQITARENDDINSLPVEFKTIIGADGGTLDMFDQTKVHENPLLAEEMLDTMNGNHIRILIKFFTPNTDYLERFPLDIINHVQFQVDAWSQGIISSQPCEVEQIQTKILCFSEVNNKDGQRGTILALDFTLPTKDHIANYFLLMKSNEIQITMIDYESKLIIGHFNIPSSPLLRQRHSSVQFSASTRLVSNDGEHLGLVYFVCGNYGTKDGELKKLDFELRHPIEKGLIVSESLTKIDQEFRKICENSLQAPYELAIKYRNGKRKQIILNEVQKRFLRTRRIFPVPGVESKFTFVSAFDPEKETNITVSIDDERIRLLGFTPEKTLLDEIEGRYKPIRNSDMKLLQYPNISVADKFSLISFGSDKITVKPGQKISLDFSFFTPHKVEDKEVTVSMVDDDNEICDLFTVQIIATRPVIHETITKYVAKGSAISTRLYSSLPIKDACSSSDLIMADANEFGARITTNAVDKNISSFIFFFGEDGALIKVCQFDVVITVNEILTVGSRMKLPIKRCIGHTIVARSNNNKIAQFTTHISPAMFQPPGELNVIAANAGNTLLTIFDVDKHRMIANIILSISMTQEGEVQKCLEKISLEIPLNKLEKRIIEYHNRAKTTKKIMLTTSHPGIIDFDPTTYDIQPGEIAKLRILFNPHDKKEKIIAHVFIQDRRTNRSATEYYRFNLNYK